MRRQNRANGTAVLGGRFLGSLLIRLSGPFATSPLRTHFLMRLSRYFEFRIGFSTTLSAFCGRLISSVMAVSGGLALKSTS